MSFNISEFRNALKGGARANQFYVEISPPSVVGGDYSQIRYLCKSADVPAFSIAPIVVPFRGRNVKVPGDRTYADWTATFLIDPAMNVHKIFDDWSSYIRDTNFTAADLGSASASSVDYFGTLNVFHTDDKGEVIRKYTLQEAWPNDIGAVDLSYESTDQIAELTVTFQYHYLTTE